ncbi:DUF3054 domain-containing protein [Leucobacter sp. USCH14]|uniref:DUF3054 domain-containing protein n=1 Tax=Leucobacter sp. USCH14 TaxID=3024838 RepID=UPI0030B42716
MTASSGEQDRRPGSAARRTAALAFGADALLVLLFAGIGRSSHERAPSMLGLLETAWPFVVGLGIAWLAALAFRHPLSIVRAGLPVWAGAVALGMLLRAATGSGTAPSFIIVATITLGVFLLGWRVIAALVIALRSRPARSDSPGR